MSRPSYTARLAYKEVAGHQIHLEVWLPADATGPVPAVAFLHGGGFFDGAAGDASDVNLLATLARGWAFVSLEYRLVPQVSLDEVVEDVKAGAEFVQSGKLDEALGGGKVDGSKFALYGASAGGTLALLAGYQLATPPSAIFALYPASDITHPSYTAPVNFPSGTISRSSVEHYLDPSGPVVSHAPANVDFSTFTAKDRTLACFWAVQEGVVSPMATRTTDAEELKRFVAKTWVEKGVKVPTVVLHGAEDKMVPVGTSEELVKVLKANGVDAEMIKAEGQDHGFDLAPGVWGDEEKMKVFEQANNFVARYL